MLMVGLTGGIGAGKSAVAQRLVRCGAVLIDADQLAREVVAKGTDGLAEVVEAFGPSVLGPGGELDRPALGERVFADDDARGRLESIIHPRVRARTAALAHAAPDDAIVVNDVPLLVEAGLAPTYHLVVVVLAAAETRIRRLAETRRMAPEQAAARIAAQADDARRRAVADVVIENDAGLDELNARVDRLWRDRLVPFEANLRHRQAARHSRTVRIAGYDPSWPTQADRLIARLRHAVGSGARISHIGSTAAPCLPAKDQIDLMLAVRTLDEADALADTLARAGFPAREGEWADNARGIPGKTWPKRLHGNADPGRSVNLHLRVAGSPGWRFALLMRDHLRAVPEVLEEYAAAKQEWEARHRDLNGYAEAKEPWLDAEAVAADEWAEATGWHPPPWE